MIIPPSRESVDVIAQNLKQGKVVVLPSDTVYALSCDASNEEAIKEVYKLKIRNGDKALPIFCSDITHAKMICEMGELATALAEKYWPGALTIVLPIKGNVTAVHKSLMAKDRSVAVRVPDSAFIKQVIKKLGKPITGTSANISGCVPIHDLSKIEELFNQDLLAIEGENKGIPSTIIKMIGEDFKVLREGKIPADLLYRTRQRILKKARA